MLLECTVLGKFCLIFPGIKGGKIQPMHAKCREVDGYFQHLELRTFFFLFPIERAGGRQGDDGRATQRWGHIGGMKEDGLICPLIMDQMELLVDCM